MLLSTSKLIIYLALGSWQSNRKNPQEITPLTFLSSFSPVRSDLTPKKLLQPLILGKYIPRRPNTVGSERDLHHINQQNRDISTISYYFQVRNNNNHLEIISTRYSRNHNHSVKTSYPAYFFFQNLRDHSQRVHDYSYKSTTELPKVHRNTVGKIYARDTSFLLAFAETVHFLDA